MNYLAKPWNWLSGKKSYLGLLCLFLDGGLAALGYEVPGLKELGYGLLGVGTVHKLSKLEK
jgi:hypothetical protein|tara:strand:- start:2124 stop:2306 length:183 start_codon:yes stop_codon:yes gene_type:complete